MFLSGMFNVGGLTPDIPIKSIHFVISCVCLAYHTARKQDVPKVNIIHTCISTVINFNEIVN